jgi:hypothetical protein
LLQATRNDKLIIQISGPQVYGPTATGCDQVHPPRHPHRFYEIEVREEDYSGRGSSAPCSSASNPIVTARGSPVPESELLEAKKTYEKSKAAIEELVAAGIMSEAEAARVYTYRILYSI